MAKVESYNQKYLRMKPEVNQIFSDLEEYQDWVRFQVPAVPFDEVDLYNHASPLWQKFQRQRSRRNYK